MLSRTLKRTLLDPKYGLPPTFLLPWTAGLTTLSTTGDVMPPPLTPKPVTISGQQKQGTTTNAVSSDSTTLLSESVRQLLPALRAQRHIYITVHIHGKAYLVQQGDMIRLPFVMNEVEPGDVLRLNCALNLGSRDFTLKPGAAQPQLKSTLDALQTTPEEMIERGQEEQKNMVAPHFVPHIAKGKHSYLDERLYVCRALVMGVESEPLRVKEKTKRRQRHIKHVWSKHKSTVLRIKELQVRSVEEIENDSV